MDDAEGTVWRGLTKEQVKDQYDMRVAVPDGPAYVARYRHLSEEARRSVHGIHDIRYGKGPRQLVDIFPARTKGGPVAMFVHGGAWRYLSKNDFSFIAAPLIQAGITAVLVGYGLIPDVSLRGMMVEIREAIAWICQNIARYGGDPRQLTVAGHSAGAQLSAMALAYDFRRHGLERTPVRGAFLLSCVYDFEPHRHHDRYRDMGLDDDLTQAASPSRNPPLDPDVPLLIGVGAKETTEYVRLAYWYGEICAARGHPVRIIESPGDHHFAVVERLGDPQHRLTKAFIELATGKAVNQKGDS